MRIRNKRVAEVVEKRELPAAGENYGVAGACYLECVIVVLPDEFDVLRIEGAQFRVAVCVIVCHGGHHTVFH